MKILLATDGSEYSRATLETILGRFRTEGVEVLALHVVEPMPPISTFYGKQFTEEWRELHEQARQRAEEMLGQAVEHLRAGGFRAERGLVEGHASSAIVEAAGKWGADMIIVGSHSRSGLGRFFLGSCAEAVSRYAHCSVLIVRLPAEPGEAGGGGHG